MSPAARSVSSSRAKYPRTWILASLPLALVSSVLMFLSVPPCGARYGFHNLIWVAPVPLFLAAHGVGGKRGFFLGWLAGMAFECGSFLWILYAIRSFTATGAILSSLAFLVWLLYHSLPWGILGWALGRCREATQVLWVIPLWVGVEDYFPRLFPWHLGGGALYHHPWLLQSVDLIGASGLTALVFLVSGVIFLATVRCVRRERFPWGPTLAAALLLVATLVYGALRLESLRELERELPGLQVGFVQGSLRPAERADGGSLTYYLEQSEKLLREAGDLDLLVWPEGAIPYPFGLSHPMKPWSGEAYLEDGRRLRSRLMNIPVPLVAGGSGVEFRGDDPSRYNVAVYLRRGETPKFYRKNHRLLFGEHFPLLDLLPENLRKVLPNVGNLSAGTDNPAMEHPGGLFRNLICYEAVLPSYARRSADGVGFLVNVTEDYWYGKTAHVEEHLSVLLLRAVESRTPMARCTNVGPSGVATVTGEFRGTSRVFEPDSFVVELKPVSLTTVYQRGGHLFSLLCLLAGIFGQWRLGRPPRQAG